MYIMAEPGINGAVIYIDSANKRIEFSGGSRSWRNSNPGNLRPGAVSKQYGQIGVADDFAVFPSSISGRAALLYLLTHIYCHLNISQMIAGYAPTTENNTENYEEFLYKSTGIPRSKIIKSFTTEELLKLMTAIIHMEGWKEGTIIIPSAE